MKLRDIPRVIQNPNYTVSISWYMLESQLEEFSERYSFDMDPDFQRGHVWTEQQQTAYLEAKLRGVPSGEDILWNCPGWQSQKSRGVLTLVDGKQRITAVLKFLRGELKVFGLYLFEFEDSLDMMNPQFIFKVNNLRTRPEVLTWYLELNGGGTPHTQEELGRVAKMLESINSDKD